VRALAPAVFAVLLSFAVRGQDVVWERTGQPDTTLIGDYAKFIGDVDGDGFDDLVMRAWRSPRWTPELWLLSGRDGHTIRTQQLPPTPPPGIAPMSFDDWGPAGDMDGDGTPDYVFAAFENAYPSWLDHLEVHSGRDGSLILRLRNPSGLTLRPGADVLGGRDLTGDGRPDLVLLWGVDVQNGIVAAFDHTGRPLYRHVGSWSSLSYTVGSGQPGNRMGWVGDVDGDGADDFTLGSYDGGLGRYVALVLSGRTGQVLLRGLGANALESIGWCADGCGDVDLDGVPDFVAGGGLWLGEQGQMHVFSGSTGQAMRSWTGNFTGKLMRGGGFDHDRDGVPDLVFYRGERFGEVGIHVCSVRDGGWTHRVLFCGSQGGTSRSCAYGSPDWSSIDVGRPQPGNPYPVFVFPEPTYGLSPLGWPLGRIRMYRSTPAGVEPYGTACSGTLPSRPQMGIRDLQGRRVRLQLSLAPRAAYAVLALGFSRTQWNGVPLPFSLAGIGLPGCSLFTSADILAATQTGTVGPGMGYASLDLPLPLRPAGQETFVLHGQWLVLDPTSLAAAASDAHLWRH
jgi:hypothetical protein